MSQQERTRIARAAIKRVEGCSDTPFSGNGQKRENSPIDQAATTPNFLDILNDCADNVDFQVKADQIAHGEKPTGKGMSQKKCLFCS